MKKRKIHRVGFGDIPLVSHIYAELKTSGERKTRFPIPSEEEMRPLLDAIRATDIGAYRGEYVADLLAHLAGNSKGTLFGEGRGAFRAIDDGELNSRFGAVCAAYEKQTGRKSWRRAAESAYGGLCPWDAFRLARKKHPLLFDKGRYIGFERPDLADGGAFYTDEYISEIEREIGE